MLEIVHWVPARLLNPSQFHRCLPLQVSSSNATSISQPILQLSDAQAQVGQVAQAQDLNSAGGQTLQSVQLVNPGTFLIQAQTVTATGQIQWQTFQVTCTTLFVFASVFPRWEDEAAPCREKLPADSNCACLCRFRASSHSRDSSCPRDRARPSS